MIETQGKREEHNDSDDGIEVIESESAREMPGYRVKESMTTIVRD